MPPVQFFRHGNPSALLQLLRPHFPTTAAIFHRIKSPQNTPDRQTLLLASVPPSPSIADLDGPVTISFVDRSRHDESQVAVFNSLCLQAKRPEELTVDAHQLLIAHLHQLLQSIKDVGDGYATAEVKPLNYPFSPTLRFTAVHELLATVLVEDVGVSLVYRYEWDQLIFSTSDVKDMVASRRLPDGYELGTVPPDQIDLVTGTSKVKRQASTLLENPNAAVMFSDENHSRRVVAWAYLSIDKSLTTLYVLPEHRGKGLAKIVAGSLMRDLYDGVVGPERAQSDWCIAQVASDNAESQAVCKSLGARLHGKTVSLGIDLNSFN
ncbi:hypothetical protein PISL3812_05391 [Talaromyces islandicus]|uniref:GCN5-related N-acetyltransferase Rv2170-like domain-containing protein n=1 Tax=Talaromyces islandicus TaxID=28573 RepID=A0A0U1M074_TALIS|nr:hypothetical protein PISL3812_05391 [Talaromyces islandicus]